MNAQCCICAELFESSLAANIAASPCGHTFHKDCLMRWVDISSRCPSCRTHINKNQIIQRLFFDIREEVDAEDIDDKDEFERLPDLLLNKIDNLKARLSETDKQKQELAESRDELRIKLNEEQNNLKLLRKENAALIEKMKEFRKAQRRMHDLQNIGAVLKGCDSEVQEMVIAYSTCSIKQLARALTSVNKVMDDRTALHEQVWELELSFSHFHTEAQKSKQEVKELRTELDRVQETHSQKILQKCQKKKEKQQLKENLTEADPKKIMPSDLLPQPVGSADLSHADRNDSQQEEVVTSNKRKSQSYEVPVVPHKKKNKHGSVSPPLSEKTNHFQQASPSTKSPASSGSDPCSSLRSNMDQRCRTSARLASKVSRMVAATQSQSRL